MKQSWKTSQGHQTKPKTVNEARRLFSFSFGWRASKVMGQNAPRNRARSAFWSWDKTLLPRSCCSLRGWLCRTFQNSSDRVGAQILTQWMFQSGIGVLCPNLQLSGIGPTAGSRGQGPQATCGDCGRRCVVLVHQLHLFQDELRVVSRDILGGYHAKSMLHTLTRLWWILNEISQVPGITVCHHSV